MQISFEEYIQVLSEQFGEPAERIVEVNDFAALGVDSLSLFSILTEVEEKFGIELDVEDLTEISSVRKMYDYITAHASTGDGGTE